MRRLLILLLMMNLLYALWGVLRPSVSSGPVVTSVPQAGEAALVLLREMEYVDRLVDCYSIAPFDDEQAVQAFASDNLSAYAWRVQLEEAELPHMHRVYLPSPGAWEQALVQLGEVRREIGSAGLMIDSYLVSGGDLNGAVSLGLFVEEANALSVRRQMDALGVPVQMRVEERSRNFYSILLEVDEGSDFIQESDFLGALSAAGLAISQKLCEMIALPD